MESHESELTSSSSSVYKERKSASCRPTAFTVFCREYCQDLNKSNKKADVIKQKHCRPRIWLKYVNKQNHSGFNPAKWKSEWELKSADEKKSYAEKAKMQLLQNNPKTIRKLLANLEWTHKELDRLGLPSFSLVSNPSTDTIFSVVFGKAKNFINEYEVEKNFGNFVSRRSFNNPNQVPADTGHLRKQVRGHMQNLYKSATGKTGKFPYSKVKTGEVIVDGVPTEVLPLQPPSHYGIHKLNVLLSIKSISISYANQQNNEDVVDNEAAVDMVESADTEVEDNTGVRISMQEASCSQAGENGNEEEMQTDIQDMDEEIAVEPIVKDIAKEFRKVIKCQSKGKGTKKNFKEKDVYYVENLLKKRKNGKKTEYLVQWMGFKNPTWEPGRNIPTHIIENFETSE